MKKRNLDIAKKTSEVKNQNLTGGEQQHLHHQKMKSLRPKPTAIQATKNTIYQQKKTSIAILYLCYLRTARHKM